MQNVPEPKGDNKEDTLVFVETIFQAIYYVYANNRGVANGETMHNSLLLFFFFKAVSRAVATVAKLAKSDSCKGEVCLEAMTKQLNSLDERTRHKADSAIKVYGFKDLKVLLLETSSFFSCADQTKSKFDHHKGLFGSLAMVKTIADQFQYGSLETFKKTQGIFPSCSQ